MITRIINKGFLLLLVAVPILSFAQNQKKESAVSGVVVNSEQEPLPGILITLDPGRYATVSDAAGGFSFVGIATDSVCVLVFSGINFGEKVISFTLKPQEVLDLDTIVMQNMQELEEVVVEGQISDAEAKALNMTKQSNKQITVVSAEELEKLPTKNAADAVAHVPGVAVQRNQGENSMVSLRGTPGDWSATLLNGDRLPVADEEQQTRSFEFEALPAEVIDYVIESKTVSADMESDNIGGAVNFITRIPATKKTFNCDVAGGLNAFSGKPTGSLVALYGNVSKNKKFSFVTDVSYYGRNYSINAEKLIYGSNFNHGINRFELRRYDGIRTTVGGNAGMEYRVNKRLKFGSNLVGGYMADDKYMKKESFNWLEESGTKVIRLQNTHGVYNRRIYGGDVHAEFLASNRLTLKMKLAYYDNRFWYGAAPYSNRKDKRNGFFVTEFMSEPINFTDLVGVDKFGNASSDPYAFLKLIGADNPYGTGDSPLNIQPKFTNQLSADKFHFSQCYTETNQTREYDPVVTQADANYKWSNRLSFQFGVKYRHKIGYRHISKHEWFQNFNNGNSEPILLSSLATENFVNHPENFMREQGGTYTGLMFPFLTRDELDGFLQNDQVKLREVEMNYLNYQYNQWVGSNYDYREDQTAAYGMFEYAIDKFNINGGVRIENTRLLETSDTLTSTIAFDEAAQQYYYVPEKRTTDLNYNAILPSVNTVFVVNKKSNLRFAASRTMHRPNFEETKPGHAVIRYNELEYTYGNPNLKPTFSYNFDACYEYFYGLKGYFLVGSYYKNIKDHIFAISTGAVDSISGIVTKRYDNAPNSWVWGVEGIFVRKLDFLKGAWKNIGFNANVTYSISRMRVPGRTASQPMVGQTPLLFNVGLSYESEKIEAKVELGYNGAYLKQLNLGTLQGIGLINKNSDYDVFVNRYYSLDAEFTYQIKEGLAVFAEANNLLNSPDRLYIGQSWRVYKTEYFGIKAQIGVKVDL